jgi:SulP family sulfate permease
MLQKPLFTIEHLVPAVSWLRSYRRKDLRGDMSAGLTVGVMLVPQGMAYAMLAGLPPVIGLYASTIPIIIYALFGSSRHLAIGPVAVVSLLVFSACSKLASPGSADFISLVLVLSLMVGVIQLFLGFLRLGFLVNFFSHAVISGFTSAAAVLIILSQIKHLFGVTLTGGGHSTVLLLWEIFRHLGEINVITLVIGISSIAVLVLFRKKFPLFPVSLLMVAVWTVLVYSLDLRDMGVQTVGAVPAGLPSFSIPHTGFKTLVSLLPAAISIFFVGYMEAIAIAQIIAAKKQYTVDPNQELRSLGLANIFGSFFSAYPVTGGFSRTAVCYEAGGQTALSSLMTAVVVIMTLLFFTPLFYYLPTAVLAAIITVAVSGLIDFGTMRDFFFIRKADGCTIVITFIAALGLGPVRGLITGLVFSLGVFIWRSAYPHIAELGYLEAQDVFRNVKRFPEAAVYPHALILRIDAPLYFANAKFLEDRVMRAIVEKPDLRWIVLDLSDVSNMDAVAIHTLDHIMETHGERNIDFAITNMIGPVRDLVEKAGWKGKYGDRIHYVSIKHALRSLGVLI